MSIEQERELGFEFDRQISSAVAIVDDPVVEQFMNDLGQHLVQQIEPQPFIYRFRLIINPQLNAFAVPGGFVYLHSGTLLGAGSLDELAGVVAHEIGHVKGRHFARLQAKTAIPSLLTTLASIAAGVAAGAPEPMLAGQGINVAMQLQFTREIEAEADQLGMTYMARSGFDPRGMARFFQKIVASESSGRSEIELPPYLYSHPDVRNRILAVNDTAPTLRRVGTPPAELEAELVRAQTHLAWLVQHDRTSIHPEQTPFDRTRNDALLARAEREAAAPDLEAALRTLAEAERQEPHDPRPAYRAGELLEGAKRGREAIAAYERALHVDPTRALVYFRIGIVARDLGERQRAVFWLEQAMRRFGPGSAQQKKAAFETEKLTFRPIEEAGIADGRDDADDADTTAGVAREQFGAGDDEAVWWGRLGARYLDSETTKKMFVRWLDPSGAVFTATKVERHRPYITARLPLDARARSLPGRWRLEVDFDGDVIDRRAFVLAP